MEILHSKSSCLNKICNKGRSIALLAGILLKILNSDQDICNARRRWRRLIYLCVRAVEERSSVVTQQSRSQFHTFLIQPKGLDTPWGSWSVKSTGFAVRNGTATGFRKSKRAEWLTYYKITTVCHILPLSAEGLNVTSWIHGCCEGNNRPIVTSY